MFSWQHLLKSWWELLVILAFLLCSWKQPFWDGERSWLWLYMVASPSAQVFVRHVSEGSTALKWPHMNMCLRKKEKAIFISKGQHGQATWSFHFLQHFFNKDNKKLSFDSFFPHSRVLPANALIFTPGSWIYWDNICHHLVLVIELVILVSWLN